MCLMYDSNALKEPWPSPPLSTRPSSLLTHPQHWTIPTLPRRLAPSRQMQSCPVPLNFAQYSQLHAHCQCTEHHNDNHV